MTTQEILNTIEESGDEMLLADGFEEALVGVVEGGACMQTVACYDYEKCVQSLMERDGIDAEAAAEFLDFNAVGSHGEEHPVFLHNLRASASDADLELPADGG